MGLSSDVIRSRRRLASLVLLPIVSCSDSTATSDATPVFDASPVRLGPIIELPIASPINIDMPFQHANEPSIAARDGTVVVAYVNRSYVSEDTWDGSNGGDKQVAIAVSSDEGTSFNLTTAPGPQPNSSDPIVRVGSTGPFWLTRLHLPDRACSMATSADGEAWASVADIGCIDKPWLAIDDAGSSGWVGSEYGFTRLPADGSAPTEFVFTDDLGTTSRFIGGFVDDAGAHMLTLRTMTSMDPTSYDLFRWDAATDPVIEVGGLTGGSGFELTLSMMSGSVGPSVDGKTWILRATAGDGIPEITLSVASAEGLVNVAVTTATSFVPAAAIDEDGRLHVLWYETSGPAGVVKYARSRSSALEDGLEPAIVVDENAVSSSDWFPVVSDPWRLKEYIDVAVDGERVHLAWTHAPTPPSRVVTRWLEHVQP